MVLSRRLLERPLLIEQCVLLPLQRWASVIDDKCPEDLRDQHSVRRCAERCRQRGLAGGFAADAGDPKLGRHCARVMRMSHLGYVGVLVFILIGSAWLELVLRTRVLRRGLRLVLALVPTVVLFTAWDAYAIAQDHWDFDLNKVIGWHVVAGVPIDEVLFFIIVPFASILTLEAVRAARGWAAGDEPR